MSSIFSLGGPQYDVDDVKIAVAIGDGTFGPLVDVPSCDLYVNTFRTKSAEMRGDGGIRAIASQIEAAELQIRFGSFSFLAYQVLFGINAVSGGSAPNKTLSMKIGIGNIMPYFAIVARSVAGETSGGTLFFLPYVKIMQPVAVRLEYNAFTMPEVNGLAVADPVLLDESGFPLVAEIKGYQTMPTLAMPIP